jgi:hypothetical protein
VRGLIQLFLVAALGLIAALWTWTRPGDPALVAAAPDQAAVTVHILNNGFHTDLAVPRRALEIQGGPLAEASRSLGQGDWILIGWGDATFFVDQTPMETRVLDGVRAFLWPGNASVVMLDPEAGDPSRRFAPDRRRSLRLTEKGLSAMLDRVEGSLILVDGSPVVSTARPGDGARFFRSRETFWIGYLCNSWTARVLNAGGLAVRPLRAVTAGEIVATLDRAAKLDSAPRED